MGRRSQAREAVLKALYQDDVNRGEDDQMLATKLWEELNEDLVIAAFARDLLTGIRENRVELDRRLTELAQNWTLERMAVTDRNVMRLGAYEIIFTDTPHQIVINEAVELAKNYGDKNSGSYVNGILDRLVKSIAQEGDTTTNG